MESEKELKPGLLVCHVQLLSSLGLLLPREVSSARPEGPENCLWHSVWLSIIYYAVQLI